MVVVLAGLFMGCPTLLSPSICYNVLHHLEQIAVRDTGR